MQKHCEDIFFDTTESPWIAQFPSTMGPSGLTQLLLKGNVDQHFGLRAGKAGAQAHVLLCCFCQKPRHRRGAPHQPDSQSVGWLSNASPLTYKLSLQCTSARTTSKRSKGNVTLQYWHPPIQGKHVPKNTAEGKDALVGNRSWGQTTSANLPVKLE